MKNNLIFPAGFCFTIAFFLLNAGCSFPAVVISKTIYFSPIPSIGVGPNGLPTKKINVTAYCCPSDAIEVTSQNIVTEDDFQWVNIPLSLTAADTITAVSVCYSSTNNAYISQTRLSVMTTPDHATVMLDDANDRKSAAATCYSVNTNTKVDGTITLSLKVVVPAGGAVRIGSIAVSLRK